MNREEITSKESAVFCDIFDDDTLVIDDTTTAADIEDWDSLEQINILVALEKVFSVKFSVGEVEGLKNVGEMIDLISAKL
ncbi:MAG: acyl carrier protein [Oscillospiraceae bacterium]